MSEPGHQRDFGRASVTSGLAPQADILFAAQYLSLRAMCGRLRVGKENLHVAADLSSEVVARKGQEVASSVRSALGYWQSQAASLNAKVLTRYYALLQISIAEQVASPASTADLGEIQSHTESGHGLWTITNPNEEFPAGYMVACRNRGHFYEYCRFKGIDITPFASKARPDTWDELTNDAKGRLVSLTDLFRRIPELQLSIQETFDTQPLSFRVGYAQKNRIELFERQREHMLKTGQPAFNPPIPGTDVVTYVGIYPDDQKLTPEYLNSFGLPIKNIRPANDKISKWPYFIGDLKHPKEKFWWQCLDTYKSGYCGTSIIVPLWNQITDPFLIHFTTLFALSIPGNSPAFVMACQRGVLATCRANCELGENFAWRGI